MPQRFVPHVTAAVLLAGLLSAVAIPAEAQRRLPRELIGRGAGALSPQGGAQVVTTGTDTPQARDVREQFREVMSGYPPALGRILKLDPALMSNPDYLAPYPALAAYLQAHPEVARYPAYFMDFVNVSNDNWPDDPEQRARMRVLDFWGDVIRGLTVFAVVIAVALTLTWIMRYAIEHRRWLRATKMRSEMQTRLLERMSSADELLAYVQSPAGQSLLQGVPVSIDPAPARGLGAPVGRILLAVQAGFVLAAGGAGLLVIRNHVAYEVTEVLFVLGTVGVSLGIGFALAAGASYLLSHRLGLFDAEADRGRPASGL
jgi:hypothetical protein